MKTNRVIESSKHLGPESLTIGLDLGDKKHTICVLDASGEVRRQGKIANDRVSLSRLAEEHCGSLVVMEAGVHSPWVSRFLQEQGCRVIVANPRKVRAIYHNERKSDERDAQMLARLGRADVQLLHPIEHGGEQAQKDLLGLKLRDALVRSRVNLINAVRFTLKSLGYQVSNPSSERFHKTVAAEVPPECLALLAPLLEVLKDLSGRIKEMERELIALGRQRYPQAGRLAQIDGVGPITSLYFVLKVGDPQRFGRARDVGPYLGLCPKRDQSGAMDKQLGISKCGDDYLRRLLVSAAHYILGPFGPPCALRACGERLMGQGSAREKKRAVVAVARKLAVLMLSLWKSGAPYERRAAVVTMEGGLCA